MKIKVVICTGTTCHVMGSEALMELSSRLPQEFGSKVHIEASPCLGKCLVKDQFEPPYVTVNGQIIGSATMAKVADKIREIVNNQS